MNSPSKALLAMGAAVLAHFSITSAAEPTAQLWHELGAGSASDNGISNETTGAAATPSAVVSATNGNVFVAWESASSEIYLRKWTGAEWVQVGGSATAGGLSNTLGKSRYPSVALSGEGVPVVAWLDSSSGNWEVYLKRFNPATNTWVGVAGSAEGGGVSKAGGAIASPDGARPTVATGGNGQLFVSWAKNGAERHVIVSAVASGGWTALGGRVDGVEYMSDGPTLAIPMYEGATDPTLVVGADQAPVAAYITRSSTSDGDVHVRRWSGTAWLPLGAGAATNGGISAPLPGTEYRLSAPRLAFAPNGQLHAAWLFDSAAEKLAYVKRLELGTWVSAGPALATPLAILQSGISLGFGPDSSPLLAWAHDLPVLAPVGNSEIYVAKLVRSNTGAVWQEFGTGSASGLGISESPRNSTHPALAFSRTGAGGIIAAWADASDVSEPMATQIYVRRSQPSATVVEFAQGIYSTKEGAPPAVIHVFRKGNLSGETRVRYATQDDTATAGADYTAAEGELVFAPFESSKSFTVTILPDNLVEPSEKVRLVLSGSNAGTALGVLATATLVIADAPPPPTGVALHFRQSVAVGEGAGKAVLEVVREGDAAAEVTVDYATLASTTNIGGFATPNADYTPVTGTLTFAAGVTARSFEIPILEDNIVEGRESLGVVLQNPTGGAVLVAPAHATIVIEDNDQPVATAGRLQFRAALHQVNEGAGHISVEVIRVEGATGEVSVSYETYSGTAPNSAIPGADYTAASGTLVFADGVTTRSFQIPILEDTLVEGNEIFGVKLSAPTGGATLGLPLSAGITIADNDAPPPPLSAVQFNPGEYSVREDAGTVTLRVVRSGDTSGPASVEYVTPAVVIAVVGVAVPGFDFEFASGTLNFAAGETEKTITVIIKPDDLEEPNEYFHVNLQNPVGTALGPVASAKVVITSQLAPRPGVFGFASSEFRVSENVGAAVITVVRREGSSGEASVHYATAEALAAPRPATAGEDYTPASGVLTFVSGETSKTFTVPILQDTIVEGTEVVLLRLSEATGAGLPDLAAKATLIIADDDQAAGEIQFSSATAHAREGAGSIALIVTRKEGGAGEVSVDYATADGTAKAGSDYTSIAGTLTFAAGQLSKAILVPIAKDGLVEGPETFTVTLSNPTGGATLGTPQTVTVAIVDSEPSGILQFYRAEYVSIERTGAVVVHVLRSEGAAGEVTVNYATSDGTAIDGEDYTGTTGTLTFAHGQRIKSFTVPIINDTVPEAPESFSLLLSGPTGGAVLGARNMAKVNITDDDRASKLQFVTREFRVREDNLSGTALISVSRRGSVAGVSRVHYATANGTATAGEDYTETTGVLEFAPGQYVKSFRIPILKDAVTEGGESVQLTLSEPEGAILGEPASATLSIVDPEAKGVQFGSANFHVNEAGGTATITVIRTGTLGAISVDYSVAGGTATETDDFTAVSGTLTFASGEAKKTFTIPIVADAVVEGPETILLQLSNPTEGALLGTPAQAILTIVEGITAALAR